MPNQPRHAYGIIGSMAASDVDRLTAQTLRKRAGEEGFALHRDGSGWRVYSNPSEILEPRDEHSLIDSFHRIQAHIDRGEQAAGLIRYEAGYALEPRLRPLLRDVDRPLAWFGLYNNCEILDDLRFAEGADEVEIRNLHLGIARDDYLERITEIRRLIEDGEVYQINFTTRVRFETSLQAWDLFCALFRRHPVPYAAFLNLGDERIISLSPELFFRIENERITVRPMKGTAPRGRSLDEDIAAGETLRVDPKNRAENVMIADLMRNDLGRICRAGTVKTPKLFEVERYPSVWQMTSTVEGQLVEGCSLESMVRALFPSGSVTGAPKIRAMEHIAHLESSPREAYTGAIGFFGPHRSVFNVAIRTITLRGRFASMGIGGGITYGSSAPVEWEECHWKAAFLTQTQPEFEILETMHWDGEYRHFEDHISRMRQSADYFGFQFDESAIRLALHNLAATFSDRPQRIRVILDSNGALEIEHREYHDERFGRVRISSRAVSSTDRFLFHKTTNRAFYNAEAAAARDAGFDDTLFFNERGELTEGSIHNVFVVKDGIWRTPPISCGLLPGTCRAQVLRDQPSAREEILTMEDLVQADAIYLCNSVRGVYRVDLVLDESSVAEHAAVPTGSSIKKTRN
jgi:para-aminobenzoate synthetase / 4-amino-4-deoxychorismate lyase